MTSTLRSCWLEKSSLPTVKHPALMRSARPLLPRVLLPLKMRIEELTWKVLLHTVLGCAGNELLNSSSPTHPPITPPPIPLSHDPSHPFVHMHTRLFCPSAMTLPKLHFIFGSSLSVDLKKTFEPNFRGALYIQKCLVLVAQKLQLTVEED